MINTIEDLKRKLKNGGFTIDGRLRDYTGGGYAVAIKDHEYILDTLQEAIACVYVNLQLLEVGQYVGGWYNKKDGRYYIDISIIEEDKDLALTIGLLNEQKAIYNFNTGEDIELKDYKLIYDFIAYKVIENDLKYLCGGTARAVAEVLKMDASNVNKLATNEPDYTKTLTILKDFYAVPKHL